MTDLRQNSMTGEQWVFEERSADPASTEEGERWLRTDLNSGDKIATLRVDVGSSIRDVPIFATGTAVDTVSEAMRIQVNGVTGYVPIAPVSDAAFPELRIQHNSQVHGFHNRVDPGPAIPDSVVDNFEDGDISEYAGDTSLFEITTTSPLEGDRSLRSTEDTFNGIISTSGLPAYPAKGQEFSYLTELRGSATATTPIWGATDLNNYYGFRLDNRVTNQKINVRSGGGSNMTTLFTASPSQGQPYEVVVEWHDGTGSESDNTIVVTVYEYDTSASERGAELGSGSIVDSTHATDTGIGFRTFGDSGNTENIYDLCGIWGPVE